MSESLFSPSWYRVAQLRPRLRSHAQVHRHTYRGQLWYVLQDHATGRFHRFTPAVYHLIGLMDGRRTVQSLWDAATTHLGDAAPTQDETIRLLGQLHAADVLQSDVSPDALELFDRGQSQERSQWKGRLMNPFSQRFSLLDPDRFLVRCLPLVRPLFSWLGAVLWMGVVGTAVVLAAAHWNELSHDVMDRMLTAQNLFLLWLTYPCVKVLHELGHAFATRVWGGEVHEMGIMLLVLVPIPYVDASAASAYPDKRRRMVVGAAGILVELFLASLALMVWLNVESGVVRAVAYNVMLIGSVSTILFNGNPLLRFDGYYILADAIDIPNLNKRSTSHLGYLVERHLFGVEEARSPATAPGEAGWFVGYGIASMLYRVMLIFIIALAVASRFPVVGVLLALWALISQVVFPLVKHAGYLLASPRIHRHRLRAITVAGVLVASLVTFVLCFPVPLRTRAEGVIWLPEQALVRAASDGFIKRILATPFTRVAPGDPLLETEDPMLESRVRVLEARLRELRAEYSAAWGSDPAEAEILKERLAVVEADLARARERSEQLVIRSLSDGIFVLPQSQDLPGRFLKQGELVAYVADLSTLTARVVVSQAEIGLVRNGTRSVEVRLADRIAAPMPASIEREIPAASDRLPSAALGTEGGGRIPVDPSDPEHSRALEKVFQFDLKLPEYAAVDTIGGRVHVLFDHGAEPLAQQSFRRLRRLFLRRFGV